MQRRPTVVGNWKMNGTHESVAALVSEIKSCAFSPHTRVIVLPPFIYLHQVASAFPDGRVEYGAQNVANMVNGAYTGEVSATMLADVGCRYALVGHSERRSLYNESDEDVVKKIALLQQVGIIPILCVGETGAERQAGDSVRVVTRQLAAVRRAAAQKPRNSSANQSAFHGMMIAYEPVWAIGTGLTATPNEAQTMHRAIRDFIAEDDRECAQAITLLYGGSVKAENAKHLAEQPDIDGMLVGGASLVAKDFLSIIDSVKGN